MERYLEQQVQSDLGAKMVLLGGPRQVGKTTLARNLQGQNATGYLNWDIPAHREFILKRSLPDTPLWVLDEIHKFRTWRNFLKGLYDEYGQSRQILVTGSARLDYYRFGGDSLQGRYHYLRLHPFSFAELQLQNRGDLQDLLRLGGFPEPFLGGSEKKARRWSLEYRNRLIREEILFLEQIKDLGRLEQLMLLLPERVGSPLSLNGLREDLQVNHETVRRWMEVLERFYAIFRISPFSARQLRALKKEQKHYHFDWTLVQKEGPRFENLVASHLLKWVHFQYDTEGVEADLSYFRDVDGREVDFVVLERRKPVLFVECKLSEGAADRSLRYLKERFPAVRAVQVTASATQRRIQDGIELIPATDFLTELV
ncbi:MAG: ATP-binding protein [Spirochaetales bacterium]|nr:ATP-binding protein [Spirochaetales bacterium]